MRLVEIKELISVEDKFENDELVLMKVVYKKIIFKIYVLSLLTILSTILAYDYRCCFGVRLFYIDWIL